MDRVGADFNRVLNHIKGRLGATPLTLQLPIGSEENFKGVVDLVEMNALYWEEENKGTKYTTADIPPEMLEEATRFHEELLEAAGEANEELMEKYLSDGKLSPDEIRAGIRQRVIANEIVPVLCGTAFKNKGVQALLDAVVYYLPSPLTCRRCEGKTVRIKKYFAPPMMMKN